MGLQHRKHVYAIPPGFVTPDERLVLHVLADQTNDKRMEYAHDRNELQAMLGGVSREWLRRRLASLEDAGFIRRRNRRRGDDERWQKVAISIGGLSHAANNGTWNEQVRPTSRAKAEAKRRGRLR